jgi:hypothetical protein
LEKETVKDVSSYLEKVVGSPLDNLKLDLDDAKEIAFEIIKEFKANDGQNK